MTIQEYIALHPEFKAKMEAEHIEHSKREAKPSYTKALAIIIITFVCIFVIVGAVDTTPPAPHVQTTADARRSAALDKLDAIVVHCPSFWDAPLGNKPCPQQEAIDYAKSVVRMSAD